MARAKTSPPSEAVLVIFAPRDLELAEFVEDALAFKPVSVRIGRTIEETLAALRGSTRAALVVDVDAMIPELAVQLQIALADGSSSEWRGPLIGIGSRAVEPLRFDHVLGSRVTSYELRNLVSLITADHARAPNIEVPMRT
jgi:hypothetical protein